MSSSVTVTVSNEDELRASQRIKGRLLEFPDGVRRFVQLKAIDWQGYDEIVAFGVPSIELTTIAFDGTVEMQSGRHGERTNSFLDDLTLCLIESISTARMLIPPHNLRPANFSGIEILAEEPV